MSVNLSFSISVYPSVCSTISVSLYIYLLVFTCLSFSDCMTDGCDQFFCAPVGGGAAGAVEISSVETPENVDCEGETAYVTVLF